jgi:hypothetical protein
MLQVDEATMQRPLKDIDHLDLALPKIPTKVLYKLQISVAQEIQSRAHADATSLQLAKEVNNTLEITLNQVKFERDETKKCTGRIEKQVEEVFKTISDSAQGENIPTEDKIEKITQAMETYRIQITELTELLVPSTPPEVRIQREQEATGHTESIALIIQEITELYNKSAQLWTNLQEDGKLQELDQKEEGINTVMQELKQKKKTMTIPDRLKSAQEMKNLQAELKSIQVDKQSRQAQLEPLQEGAEQMLTEIDTTKGPN